MEYKIVRSPRLQGIRRCAPHALQSGTSNYYMYMVTTVTHVQEQHSYMYMVTMVTYVPMMSPATVCSCAPHPWTSHGLSDKSHRTSSSLPGSPSLRPHPL